jgi:membrane protein required for colicin V production
MNLALNGLDVAIVVVGGLGILSGLARGALRMVTSLVAIAAALYFASIYYQAARDITLKYVPVTPTVAAVIGYAIVFLAVIVVVQSAGALLLRLLRTASLGWIDRLLGAAVGGAIAVAIMGLVLMLLTATLPTNSALLKQSQLTPLVLEYTDALIAYIPSEVRNIYVHKRNELMHYWMSRQLGEQPSPGASSTP